MQGAVTAGPDAVAAAGGRVASAGAAVVTAADNRVPAVAESAASRVAAAGPAVAAFGVDAPWFAVACAAVAVAAVAFAVVLVGQSEWGVERAVPYSSSRDQVIVYVARWFGVTTQCHYRVALGLYASELAASDALSTRVNGVGRRRGVAACH